MSLAKSLFFKTTTTPNAEIEYEVIPNCLPQTTLFIHGNLASHRWWYPTEESAKRKYKGQSLTGDMILVNFRGCGKSTAPKSVNEVSMQLFAEDFNQLAASLQKKSEKMNLVGHSTGGLIASLMLVQKPELFNKAILLDPVGATGVQFEESMNAAFEQMKADKNLTAIVLGSTIQNNNPETDFFKQVIVEDAYSAVKAVGAWVLQSLKGLNVKSELMTIQNPVLVLHGENDNLLPMADSKEMATLMKNAHFETIPGQGHCTNVENPEKFVQIMDGFLF